MRLVFITKDYPPHQGGMARYSQDLKRNLSDVIGIDLLRHKGVKKTIPLFALRAIVQSILVRKRADLYHVSCGMLSPVGWAIRQLTGKPVSITVHGLDITRKNRIYRAIVLPALRRLDHVVCVSGNTARIANSVGVKPEKITVIPNGIDFRRVFKEVMCESEWRDFFGLAQDDRVLVTVGNFTARKGQLWWIEHVLPAFRGQNVNHFFIGDGRQRSLAEARIRELGLEDQAYVLGPVDQKVRDSFYVHADAYVMPNIPIEGDAEGFGIVAIEAGAWGLPVITSGIEGISDAILDGQTAVLLYRNQPALEKEDIRRAIRERFDWSFIAKRYKILFEYLIAERNTIFRERS